MNPTSSFGIGYGIPSSLSNVFRSFSKMFHTFCRRNSKISAILSNIWLSALRIGWSAYFTKSFMRSTLFKHFEQKRLLHKHLGGSWECNDEFVSDGPLYQSFPTKIREFAALRLFLRGYLCLWKWFDGPAIGSYSSSLVQLRW